MRVQDLLFCCGMCWLAGWLVGWLAGWLVGWLAGWLAGWLGGWLVGWLVTPDTRQRFLSRDMLGELLTNCSADFSMPTSHETACTMLLTGRLG